jgi:hypothetical protein
MASGLRRAPAFRGLYDEPGSFLELGESMKGRDLRRAITNWCLVALAIGILWFVTYLAIIFLGEFGIAS